MADRRPVAPASDLPRPARFSGWAMLLLTLGGLFVAAASVQASPPDSAGGVVIGPEAFQQIDNLLPTPTETRLASGAPGPAYWQQRVSYRIDATLDEEKRALRGRERVTYENHSPHTLTYLWLQMDVNQFSPSSNAVLARTSAESDSMTVGDLQKLITASTFDGAMKISDVKDASGKPLAHLINKGLLKIELPAPLKPKETTTFELSWEYLINDSKHLPGRTGYEVLADGNVLFALAHWYPRLCAYTDYGGWRVKQFQGPGEFTLEFGDYDVTLNVPADHKLSATGELVNAKEILTDAMRERLASSDKADAPVFVATPDEVDATRKEKLSAETKAWHFKATNVRDFAFATSRAFVWDAWGCPVGDGGRVVRCMSLYPREGMPLWDRYATHAIAQAVEVYSEVTGIDYPWPHATAILGIKSGGMEYPMISFNGPRPEKDGSYSEATKKALIGVVIHETGHNWFPMIVNNDERHWMWMDEGLNSFVQGMAERRWKRRLGETAEPSRVTGYITGDDHQPIMTAPDHLQNVKGSAYWKPAAGLTMLRETILGRELFDAAFKEYCRRWAWKRPEPADFFRTMEDASGVDLDWFWRGWFYSTAHCDFELVSVVRRKLQVADPSKEAERKKLKEEREAPSLSQERDASGPFRVDRYQKLLDFYDSYDPTAVTDKKKERFEKFLERLTPEEKQVLEYDQFVYDLRIRNNGAMPMPLVVKIVYEDGSDELRRYPVELWRLAKSEVIKTLILPKPVKSVVLDPYNETADPQLANNRYPRAIEDTDLELTSPEPKIANPLHDDLERQRSKAEAASPTEKKTKPSEKQQTRE